MNKELKTPETIAYEKSIRVIDSCVTEKQCDSANLFIGLPVAPSMTVSLVLLIKILLYDIP